MKKPPLPSYVGLEPQPKGNSWLIYAVIITLITAFVYYYFYYTPKPTINEQQTY